MTDAGSPIDAGSLLQTIGAYADNGPDVVQAKIVEQDAIVTSKRIGQLALFDVDGLPLRVTEAVIPDLVPSGYYTSYPDGNYSTIVATAGRLYMSKVWIPAGDISEVSTEVTLAASTGGQARLGIWKSSNGFPGELILDSGTVATDGATGLKAITVSATIPKSGWYWIGIAAQTQGCTFRSCQAANSQIPKTSSGQSAISSIYKAGITGAFTDAPGPDTNAAGMPVFHIRWA